MHVAGDDLVEGKYDTFYIVRLLVVVEETPVVVHGLPDLTAVVDVEQHKGIGLGADKEITTSDILVGDART